MRDRSLYQWFAHSADAHPDRPAIDFPDRTVDYRDLRRAARAAAAQIVQGHGGLPRRVGLLAEHSLDAYAGYLGVQLLGATVVPLSKAHPMRRNAEICTLAAVDVVFADEASATALAASGATLPVPVHTLCVAHAPSTGGSTSSSASEPGPAATDPADLAYIMFTSGSTGRPKGVPIRQRNISAYLEFTIAEYEMGPDCRLSHTFGMAFDASVYDMFCAWGAGAALVVPGRKDLHNPVDYITRRGLTHWHSVPSLIAIAQGLGNLPPGRATGLRHSIFGGERVSVRHCELWREVAPNSRIHNNYGPTETTITCSGYTLPEAREHWAATRNDSVPIGAVHRHLESLIIGDGDQDGGGDEGELCLRGPQRFDGYLDPDDNAGRFLRMNGPHAEILADPAEPVTAEHWYRTGDRVRRTPDGLVHLGRIDDQVKIAGYRMEPSEIEAAACRLPEVTHAVALALPGAGLGEPRLSLFYAGRPLDPGEFARRLREVLPRQMVPRTFHHVDAVPLNGNGKVDRRALAARLSEPLSESEAST